MAQYTQLSRGGGGGGGSATSLGVPGAGVSSGAEGHTTGAGSAMLPSKQQAQSAIVETNIKRHFRYGSLANEPNAGLRHQTKPEKLAALAVNPTLRSRLGLAKLRVQVGSGFERLCVAANG